MSNSVTSTHSPCSPASTASPSDLLPDHSVAAPRGKRPKLVACLPCREAGKKCAVQKPCSRCTQRGIGDACVDAPTKARSKGQKRAHYKSRSSDGESEGRGRGKQVNLTPEEMHQIASELFLSMLKHFIRAHAVLQCNNSSPRFRIRSTIQILLELL